MKVVEHSDADAFLSASAAYRAADPIRTNLLASIAEGVRAGRRYDSEHWFTVHDRQEVVGAALRTAPYRLVAGPMPLPAAQALGEHVRGLRQPLPGINGPWSVVEAVAERLGHPVHVRMRDVVRVLGVLVAPAPAEGQARPATADDLPTVRAWQSDYLAEVGLPVHVPDDDTLLLMLRRLWLWSVEGAPVAMAGHAPLVPSPSGSVARIGPVYTVPGARRRGIGAALTAVVARRLQDTGATVMLYADAANETSNRVYERLGFRAVDEHVEVDLL